MGRALWQEVLTRVSLSKNKGGKREIKTRGVKKKKASAIRPRHWGGGDHSGWGPCCPKVLIGYSQQPISVGQGEVGGGLIKCQVGVGNERMAR